MAAALDYAATRTILRTRTLLILLACMPAFLARLCACWFPACQRASLPVCMRACAPVCLLACLHACSRAYVRVCQLTCLRVCSRAYVRVCRLTCLRVCSRAYVRVCLLTCLRACSRAVCACMSAYLFACVFSRQLVILTYCVTFPVTAAALTAAEPFVFSCVQIEDFSPRADDFFFETATLLRVFVPAAIQWLL